MFVRMTSPALTTAPEARSEALLTQAAHVAGNLTFAGLTIRDGEATGQLKSHRPITAQVCDRFAAAASARIREAGFTVDFLDQPETFLVTF